LKEKVLKFCGKYLVKLQAWEKRLQASSPETTATYELNQKSTRATFKSMMKDFHTRLAEDAEYLKVREGSSGIDYVNHLTEKGHNAFNY
jgi:hypothetical protein